jgi:hypothetical protein
MQHPPFFGKIDEIVTAVEESGARSRVAQRTTRDEMRVT